MGTLISDLGLSIGIEGYLNQVLKGKVYNCMIYTDYKLERINPKFAQFHICFQGVKKKELNETIDLIYNSLHLNKNNRSNRYEVDDLLHGCYLVDIKHISIKQIIKIYTLTKMAGTYGGDDYMIKWEI